MDDKRPPIDPGPEPDTTDAADAADHDEPDDPGARLEPEDRPEMIDDGDDHVDDLVV